MPPHRYLPLIGAAAMALLLGSTQVVAGGEVHLVQLLSPRLAKQFLETVEWRRYEATQINIAEEPAWEDPAIVLDLKGDDLTVVFPNDTFLSLGRWLLGDIADPRPVEGNIRQAALDLLERDLVHVYRIRLRGSEGPDRAIILTPYTIRASTMGSTIRIKLDDNGLQMREGDLTNGDPQTN
ncbi:MAG: hypothetical protein RX318_02905 [bacterium]|nr:hypothetical protein [bacterium]